MVVVLCVLCLFCLWYLFVGFAGRVGWFAGYDMLLNGLLVTWLFLPVFCFSYFVICDLVLTLLSFVCFCLINCGCCWRLLRFIWLIVCALLVFVWCYC